METKSERLKILYIAPANSVHSYRWVYYLKNNKKVDFHWFSFHEIEEKFRDQYPGFRINHLKKTDQLINSVNPINKFRGFRLAASTIDDYISNHKITVVHIQSLAKYGTLSLFLNSKVRIIGTAWGSDVIFSGGLLRKYILRKVLKNLNEITCDALHMENRIHHLIGEKSKCHQVNFGVEMDLYELKQSLLPKDEFIILSLRNHYPVYDIETLIIAFSKLNKIVPNTKLIIAGFGDLTTEYKKLCDSLGISGSVDFTGKYDRKKMLELATKTSLYVSSSKSDAGIAASTAEIMACRIPVLILD